MLNCIFKTFFTALIPFPAPRLIGCLSLRILCGFSSKLLSFFRLQSTLDFAS